jgi:hypothetical protein
MQDHCLIRFKKLKVNDAPVIKKKAALSSLVLIMHMPFQVLVMLMFSIACFKIWFLDHIESTINPHPRNFWLFQKLKSVKGDRFPDTDYIQGHTLIIPKTIPEMGSSSALKRVNTDSLQHKETTLKVTETTRKHVTK